MSVVRIQGVPLESHKHIRIALQAVYGIGPAIAKNMCEQCNIAGDVKVRDLTDAQVTDLQKVAVSIESDLEGNLRRRIATNIKALRDSGCYRGQRHKFGLPVRGQRTRTNARTRKGKRGKVVANKK